jgi:hypothetical protein
VIERMRGVVILLMVAAGEVLSRDRSKDNDGGVEEAGHDVTDLQVESR